jgi:hypothetical protein
VVPIVGIVPLVVQAFSSGPAWIRTALLIADFCHTRGTEVCTPCTHTDTSAQQLADSDFCQTARTLVSTRSSAPRGDYRARLFVAELNAAMNLQAWAHTSDQPDRLTLTESHLIHRV